MHSSSGHRRQPDDLYLALFHKSPELLRVRRILINNQVPLRSKAPPPSSIRLRPTWSVHASSGRAALIIVSASDRFNRLGGFGDLRYNHDWDFCLRASIVAEPMFVASAEYDYRLHGANTILESALAAKAEADAMFQRFYRDAVALQGVSNPFAPVPAIWGARFFEQVLASGRAALLPGDVLRAFADRVLATLGDEEP